jgi:predicted RNA-binding Zn ribbon-like protein
MTHTGHQHHLDLDAALAFINTLEHSDAGDREDLPTLEAALGWLVAHGAMHAEAADALAAHAGADARLGEVHALRSALRAVADATVAGEPAAREAVATVNRALASGPRLELVATADGIALGHRHGDDPLAEALASVATPVAEALADGRPDRLRVCANDSCRWVFYDTSPTGRRRWCDMTTCGNRAKAARHRARLRVAAR